MKKQKVLFSMLLFSFSIGVPAQKQVQIWSDAEEAILEAHAEEIKQVGHENAEEAFIQITRTFNVSNHSASKVGWLILRRENQKAACKFVYPDDVERRTLKKMEIDKIYQDSIDILLIPHNKLSGDNISLALLVSERLKLSLEQMQKTEAKALDIEHRIQNDRQLDVWDEELNFLKNTLSSKQFKEFFVIKNGKRVIEMKDKAWEKLAAEGLTSGLDSVKVCREACWFYDEQEKIKDLYKNNPKSEQKMLSELNRRKPMMLKMLDGIDKRKKMEEEKTKENIGKDFVW